MADSPPPGFRSRGERARLELEQPPKNAAAAEARALRRASPSDDPRDTLQVIAARLGHGSLKVEPTVSGTRWFGWCECGWISTTRRDQADATGAVLHHVRKAMKAWTNSGLPLEAYGRAPSPSPEEWERLAKSYPHWLTAREHERRAEERTSANLPGKVGGVA